MTDATASDDSPVEGVTGPIVPPSTSSTTSRTLPAASATDDDLDTSSTDSRPRPQTVENARQEVEELMKEIRALAVKNGWDAARIREKEERKRMESGIPAPTKQTSPRKAMLKYKSVLETAAFTPQKMNSNDVGLARLNNVRFDSQDHSTLAASTGSPTKEEVNSVPPESGFSFADMKPNPTTPSSRKSRNTPSLFHDTPNLTVTPATPGTSPVKHEVSLPQRVKESGFLDADGHALGSPTRWASSFRRE